MDIDAKWRKGTHVNCRGVQGAGKKGKGRGDEEEEDDNGSIESSAVNIHAEHHHHYHHSMPFALIGPVVMMVLMKAVDFPRSSLSIDN